MECEVAMPINKGKIWIDLDNSPHVPFFKPIIEELQRLDYTILVTARDCFQVCGLADLLHVPYKRIGRHYGKNKLIKVAGLIFRAMQLASTVLREKPILALSHGSRSQLILANTLGIPSLVIYDYEHANGLFFIHPDCVIVPEVIPDSALDSRTLNVRKYPGIKEDVYVPSFKPQTGILRELGVDDTDIVVTLRPPATEAHYHSPLSDVLFSEVIENVAVAENTRMVLLPRNRNQELEIRSKWPALFDCRKIIVPSQVVDGLNLIWFSDLVISGGGTMNREAAAMGVPVYSIFMGKAGVVDRYLADNGRLIILQTVEDVRTILQLKKWCRPRATDGRAKPALNKIVKEVVGFVEKDFYSQGVAGFSQ